MIIGLILTAVSIVLTRESWSLLMGETAPKEVIEKVIRIAESNSMIARVEQHLSMVLSPKETLLVLRPGIKSGVSADEIVIAIQAIQKEIKTQFPDFKQVYIEPTLSLERE